MTTRPAFDPSVYETPELAELNRPIHPLAWDMIEAESALTALTQSRAPAAEWDAQFAVVAAARKAHAAALEILDAKLAGYAERTRRDQAAAYLAKRAARRAAQPELF